MERSQNALHSDFSKLHSAFDFLTGGDKVIFYGTPFSLHHSVALELDKEDPEQNYVVLCGHLAWPKLPGMDAQSPWAPLLTYTPTLPVHGLHMSPKLSK